MKSWPTQKSEGEREGPPFFSSWGRLYAAVVANLALQILLLFAFMKAFN